MTEFEDKKICFISFISRDDKPLYIQSFNLGDLESSESKNASDSNNDSDPKNANNFLKYNFLSHMALDIITSPTSISMREQQQDGDIKNSAILLLIQDDVTVYGYESNTGLKIIVGFDNQTTLLNDKIDMTQLNLKVLFNNIHKVYIKTICNPFLDISDKPQENESMLQTSSFDNKIKTIVTNWNKV